ncbi:MAG: hypothetical protein ACI9ZM_002611, partial [Paracoccaceae bacterium]
RRRGSGKRGNANGGEAGSGFTEHRVPLICMNIDAKKCGRQAKMMG